MSTYRNIQTRIWTDPKLAGLNIETRYLFLYFLTSPHGHLSGIYYCPTVLIEAETGIKRLNIGYGIDTLSGRNLLTYDTENQVVWVHNMLRHQGRGPKIVACIADYLENLHCSGLVRAFLNYYKDLNIPYRYPIDTLSKGYPIPYRYPIEGVSAQEQDQEQEQESICGGTLGLKPEVRLLSSAKKKTAKPNPDKRAVAKSVLEKLNLEANRKHMLTDVVVRQVQGILADGFSEADIRAVICHKCDEWENDEKMRKYLQPSTIFQKAKFAERLTAAREAGYGRQQRDISDTEGRGKQEIGEQDISLATGSRAGELSEVGGESWSTTRTDAGECEMEGGNDASSGAILHNRDVPTQQGKDRSHVSPGFGRRTNEPKALGNLIDHLIPSKT
jgi:uncharacterized phage protein (TIGR02220 family)